MSFTNADRLFDPDVVENPFAYFAELRDRDPVHHIEGVDAYLVTRTDLIHEVLSDPSGYSSYTNEFIQLAPNGKVSLVNAVPPEAGIVPPAVLATADPPDHERQRRVLTSVLSRKAIAEREEEFRTLVDAVLEPHLTRGRVEWMSAVAELLPAAMLARALGIPDDAAEFVKRFGYDSIEQVGGFVSDERRAEIQAQLYELGPVADAYHSARSGQGPGLDTVIGSCAAAVDSGELDDIEAFAALLVLVTAGSESASSLLGTAVRMLAQDQDLQERLRRDPGLIETFVEEACRIEPPFRGHYRRTTREMLLGGVKIPAETRLVLVWPASNRDDASFAHATTIDLDRPTPRQHLGFGWGIHLCVGAPLARLEARVTLERLLARTSRFEVSAPLEDLRHHRSLMIYRLVELPLILEG